jgi:hypothetical protein
MASDPLVLEVQQVLDELWSEKLLPFKLTVGKLTRNSSEYMILFHDSRMHSALVPLAGGSLSDRVRLAVLDRVRHLSGPLTDIPTAE